MPKSSGVNIPWGKAAFGAQAQLAQFDSQVSSAGLPCADLEAQAAAGALCNRAPLPSP